MTIRVEHYQSAMRRDIGLPAKEGMRYCSQAQCLRDGRIQQVHQAASQQPRPQLCLNYTSLSLGTTNGVSGLTTQHSHVTFGNLMCKVSHHGLNSDSANSDYLLNIVFPQQIAVGSAVSSIDGHPDNDTLNRFTTFCEATTTTMTAVSFVGKNISTVFSAPRELLSLVTSATAAISLAAGRSTSSTCMDRTVIDPWVTRRVPLFPVPHFSNLPLSSSQRPTPLHHKTTGSHWSQQCPHL